MKYLAILTILTGCSISNVSTIYPVREPFEYVMRTTLKADEEYILNEMSLACRNSFIITETQVSGKARLIYFKCNVRN